MEILLNINYNVTCKHLFRIFKRSIDFGIVVDHNLDSRFNWKGRMQKPWYPLPTLLTLLKYNLHIINALAISL